MSGETKLQTDIMSFLSENPETAFSPEEIAEGIKIDNWRAVVSPISDLRDEGKVEERYVDGDAYYTVDED